LRQLYNIPKDVAPHPNSSIGIFQFSWVTWLSDDLDYFFNLFQPDLVGKRPLVRAVNGGYMQTDHKIFPFNLEPNLDFQCAMALTAPLQVQNIQVGDISQIGTLNHMLAAFDQSYCQSLDPILDPPFPNPNPQPDSYNKTTDCGTFTPPSVISISYAYSEATFPQEYLRRQCIEFLKLGLMGVTVIAASGDYGPGGQSPPGECLGNNNRFNPTWPAACPWVTTVAALKSSPRQTVPLPCQAYPRRMKHRSAR
jgi:tripeptidyl-peptidase-1